MSKGNLILGYGRGKLGDIVMTRGEGQQISRARNRNPRNPRTQKQMYQRAVMATVMQIYKAGKSIFDHSYQGKQVALGSMSRFMSVNAKLLRAAIEADIANNTNLTSVVSPGAVAPVPNAYRISEGTFNKGALSVVADDNSLSFAYMGSSSAKIADVFTPGDIYTVVAIGVPSDATLNDIVSPGTVFGYVRLTVKDNLGDATMASALVGTVFNIETYNMTLSATAELNTGVALSTLFGSAYAKGAMGIIHSREDSGLRSTSDMLVNTPITWGVRAAAIPSVWNANVRALGDSDLILEGGDISGLPVVNP